MEGGATPLLGPDRLAALGYRIAAYPLTLLAAAAKAMEQALACLRAGHVPPDLLMPFTEFQDRVGFPAYHAESERYQG